VVQAVSERLLLHLPDSRRGIAQCLFVLVLDQLEWFLGAQTVRVEEMLATLREPSG
jgi:hypothetical protein